MLTVLCSCLVSNIIHKVVDLRRVDECNSDLQALRRNWGLVAEENLESSIGARVRYRKDHPTVEDAPRLFEGAPTTGRLS